jgi:hypothetical protein
MEDPFIRGYRQFFIKKFVSLLCSDPLSLWNYYITPPFLSLTEHVSMNTMSHTQNTLPWSPYWSQSQQNCIRGYEPFKGRVWVLYYDRQSVGHSVLEWSTIWGLWLDFYYCQTVAGLLMWGALSDERTGCRLQLLLVLASAVIFGSESHGTRDHILVFHIRNFPFRRLLRLAGLRWRFSTPPPHWN